MLFNIVFLLNIVLCYGLRHKHKYGPLIELNKRDSGCSDGASELVVNFEMGYWYSGWNSGSANEVISAAQGFVSWAESASGDTSRSYINGDVIGMVWLGNMVQNSGAATRFIQQYINSVQSDGIPNTKYVQYCETGDPAKTVGIIFDTTGGRDTVDYAMKTWSKGQCWNTNTGSVEWNDETLCYLSYANRKSGNTEPKVGTCDYIKVTSGMDLESATGVTGDALKLYNPNIDFSNLAVGTPICYSIGNAPDLRVSVNSNGTCYAYYVQSGDSCSSIAANYYPLSTSDIESYNGNTYGWKGCSDLQADSVICVSNGDAPKPIPYEKAECGPLAPGDKFNTSCPLNACCDDYGFCGLTSEFCDIKDSTTGAPGTKNCYSNCGLGEIPSGSVSSFKKVGYWLDVSEDDPMFLDTSTIENIDILHYSFMNISSDFSINIPDDFSNNNFFNNNMEKVVTFGGWDFSTDSDTYSIFRSLAEANNGTKTIFAYAVANMIEKYNIKGIDFDWEYPGAQDIPGINADYPENGQNYLELLEIIRNQLPEGYTLSVAIPSSYWYAKAFPLKEMEKYVDYFTVMTYDLYGQWTYGKADTGLICHTDKTKITDTIRMLSKAGLDFSKLHGGLANYARTYKVGTTNCIEGPICGFTGPESGAVAGDITNTPGIMSEEELGSIPSSDIIKTWINNTADCTYMLYYTDNWAAWSNDSQRDDLSSWFEGMGMGGTSLWATNYQNDDYYEDYEDDYDNGLDGNYSYVDIYNCLDNINNYGCLFERTTNEAINNITVYLDIMENILNDYDNYVKYYDAYIRSYYDSLMIYYEKWFIERGLTNYFTKIKDSQVVLTPEENNDGSNSKRDYVNNTYADLIFRNHPNLTSFIDYDPVNPIKYYRNNEIKIINNTDIIKREVVEPSQTIIFNDYIIEDGNKTSAINDFYLFSGYNITSIDFVQREKDKSFTVNNNNYIFHHTTILDSFELFPNVMLNVNQDNITDARDIINYAKENIGYENPTSLYLNVENLLAYSQIGNAANITYVNGKSQYIEYQKEEKMKILEIVLGIIGAVSIFLGPELDLMIQTLSLIADIAGSEIIEGKVSWVDIATSLAGIFIPMISEFKITKDFYLSELSSLYKNKDYKEDIFNFSFVKDFRSKICKC
nr:chitin-binding protein [Saccharomycopsis crataegensis]